MLREFQGSVSRMFKGYLKCTNSLSKKFFALFVVKYSSQLPEQKEGLFFM